MLILLYILLIAALLAAGLYGIFSYIFMVPGKALDKKYYIPDTPSYNKYHDTMETLIRTSDSIPPSRLVETESLDGLKLCARYYRGQEDKPVDIMMHGYKSSPIRDFSGGLQAALGMGHSVLLVDQRAHGESEGSFLTFGIMEKTDLLCWIRWSCREFGPGKKILLYGISMGAATVLMAAGLQLPPNVAGIVADCSYSSPKAIINKVIGDKGLPPGLVYPLVRLSGLLFGGFDISGEGPVQALKRARIPVLFIHGEADSYVPCSMSLECHNSCASEKELFTVPGADHGISFICDFEGYMKVLRAFVDKVLSN